MANNKEDIFDREIYPLPGGTIYYQMVNGIPHIVPIPPSPGRKDYYTKEEIDAILRNLPSGGGIDAETMSYEQLPAPSMENFGTIYNISDPFTTDSRFIEGAGKKYPGGTNIIVTRIGTSYLYDVLMGEIKSATDSEIQDIIDNLYND